MARNSCLEKGILPKLEVRFKIKFIAFIKFYKKKILHYRVKVKYILEPINTRYKKTSSEQFVYCKRKALWKSYKCTLSKVTAKTVKVVHSHLQPLSRSPAALLCFSVQLSPPLLFRPKTHLILLRTDVIHSLLRLVLHTLGATQFSYSSPAASCNQ